MYYIIFAIGVEYWFSSNEMMTAGQPTLCVPFVVALGPRQVSDVNEGPNEVEQRPCDDHVVVDTDQSIDY